MSGGARLPDFVRRGLPAALLLVLAASMVATLSPTDIARRGSLLLRSLAGETITAAERTGFWFDPAYGAFLEEVRRRTPRDATIAVVVPPWPDVYVYQAAYQLAPRRVVEPGRENEATFVAEGRLVLPADRGDAVSRVRARSRGASGWRGGRPVSRHPRAPTSRDGRVADRLTSSPRNHASGTTRGSARKTAEEITHTLLEIRPAGDLDERCRVW